MQKGLRNGRNMVSGNDQLHVVHWLEPGESMEEENIAHWEVYNSGKM